MNKHLFLEGQVQAGKSTLIRKCLEPYIDIVGGFSSQRIRGKDDRILGYRLVPAEDFLLDTDDAPDISGVFLYHNKDINKKDPRVFETLGVDLLSPTQNKQLILLDEIGGSELLVPEFKSELYDVLGGDIPCIGVIKLNSKAKFMSDTAGYPGKVVEANARLRQDLTDKFNARIINFDKDSAKIAEQEIKEFLEKNICELDEPV